MKTEDCELINKPMKTLLICTLLFISLCLYQLMDLNDIQQTEIDQLKQEIKEAEWHKQRVRYYLQINIRQQELLNHFPQAKKAFQNDSTLQQLNLHIQ